MSLPRIHSAGTLVWTPGTFGIGQNCIVTGWHFEGEGGMPGPEAFLEAVLRFIAQANGIDLGAKPAPAPAEQVTQPLPENFDAQRDALDAIAIARWRDDL